MTLAAFSMFMFPFPFSISVVSILQSPLAQIQVSWIAYGCVGKLESVQGVHIYIVRTSNPYFNSYPAKVKYMSGKFTYTTDKHR